MTTDNDIERHYARPALLDAILQALRDAGKDLSQLTPEDLAPIDEFHVRGREATLELAARAELSAGARVLDVGCGLGGSARHLAVAHDCTVTGVDLTHEYIDVANALARLVHLDDRARFQQASALALPFADASFDAVWTEHVQMNIADKHAFYGEIARVLRVGGKLAFHDVFLGTAEPHYPVPWAETPAISFLATPEAVRSILDCSFVVLDWEDTTLRTLAWIKDAIARKKEGASRLGLQMLMGENARAKAANNVRNLEEGRVVVVQAVMRKT